MTSLRTLFAQASWPGKRRPGLLFWACVISFFVGLIELGDPLDYAMRVARAKIMSRPASGQIVVIGIDSKSLEEMNRWPWPRGHMAEVLDKALAMGARRVFFDNNMAAQTTEVEDRKFADALKRANGRAYLATRFVIDQTTHSRTDYVPLPEFSQNAKLVNINGWFNAWGVVPELPYAMTVKGIQAPTMAAMLADKHGPMGASFPVDYSIDPRTTPVISIVDVMRDRVSAHEFAGKDVIVAPTTVELGDMVVIPGHGMMSGVFVHVVGAETLRLGNPVNGGWIWIWLVGAIAAALTLRVRQNLPRRATLALIVLGLIVAPVFLEMWLVFVDVSAALTLLGVIGSVRLWSRFRKSLHDSSRTNLVSGMKNLVALEEASVSTGAAIVAIKINNFLAIKSSISEELAKPLIDEFARRLLVGASDQNLYQGDDGVFVLVLEGAAALSIGDHIDATHALFRTPLIVESKPIHVHVTFGVDQSEERALSNRLGGAILAAEDAGKQGLRWQWTDAEKTANVTRRVQLMSQLDRAIEEGQIWVAYQPKLDLRSNRLCGAEALVRWSHPELGMIAPDEFIRLAEEENCIGHLTAFVLEQAIDTAASVFRHGRRFEMSVNLSPRSSGTMAVDSLIYRLLEQGGLPSNLLTLEVTETATMTSDGVFVTLLEELNARGINISVDDYGTGWSTLEYLKTIPATEVKIDKTFISHIDRSVNDRLMVESTIQMAHSMRRMVVAEGVENAEVLHCLKRLGCDKAQGYLIGRPMRRAALLEVLEKDARESLSRFG